MKHSFRSASGVVVLSLALMIPAFFPIAAGQGGSAGGFVWTQQFGTPSDDDGRGVAVDASGVYLAGWTSGALPDQASAGGADAFVRKYDANGNHVWTRQFGSPTHDFAFGIALDGSGVYVVGATQGILPGQSSPGCEVTLCEDAFVRKYDRNGNELWTRQFGTPSSDIAYAIAAGASGVYLVGVTVGTLPNQTSAGAGDGFIRKYATNGTEVWTRQFGTPGDEWAFGVAVEASGVYVVGEVRGLDPTGAFFVDAFARKYDPDGNLVWNRQFGTPGRDSAEGVAADGSGVYIAGLTCEASREPPCSGGAGAFVRKYDRDGNLVWNRQFGTPASDAHGVSVDGPDVFVLGTTNVALARPNMDNTDIFLRKYDADGSEQRTLQFGSSVEEDGARGLAADPLGVYVGGATFGYVLGGARAGDEADAFLARIAETPEPPTNLRATPGDGQVRLTWDPPAFDGRLSIMAYRIYRGTNPDILEPIASVNGSARAYTDPDVTNDATYYYRVAAVNGIGEGLGSPPVPATPRAPPLLVITAPTSVVTSDPHVVIEGRTEPDATVTVNGTQVPVAPDGTFQWSAIFPDGTYRFHIVAENPLGLTSSVTLTVTVDTTSARVYILLGLVAIAFGILLFTAYRRRVRRRRGPPRGPVP